MEIEVRGGDELKKTLGRLPKDLSRETKVAMAEAVLTVRTEAITSMRPGTGRIYRRKTIIHRASAPGMPPAVDTGRLRASIYGKVKMLGSEVVGAIGTNVEYAPHLEFGTARMAPRPFLRRAIEKKKKEILRLLEKAVTRVVKRASR